MLSDRNIKRINDQIESDLRKLDSSYASSSEKAQALDRIRALTALLNPQSTRDEILSELASAIVEAQNNPRTPTIAQNLIHELAHLFRN